MQEKPRFMIFEKKETCWQSIASDLTSFSLAIAFLFLSAWLNQILWTITALILFVICLIGLATESRWVKLKTKQDAVNWANSLNDDC
jgi:hypothetical protein